MRISVVIPAWNAAQTLAETLDSVAAQTLLATEVIVADDGSDDATAMVARQHPLCPTVLQLTHAGVAATTNAAIRQASGDCLAFIDADDLWPPGKLAAQAELLGQRPDIDASLGMFSSFVCPRTDIRLRERFVVPATAQPGWLTGTLCLRREVFSRVGLFSEDLSNGFAIDWFDRARKAGIQFHMTDETLLLRRLHPGSLSARNQRSDGAMLEMARRAIARRRAQETS